MNDLDTAFNYFEKAYVDCESVLVSLKHESWTPSNIKNDPRFQKLLDKIGYP
jgi:hypothetical protein